MLQRYADRWWYPPLIAVLAFADAFIIVVPTDGLLVSAVMLSPKRWIYSAILVSLGSSLGAIALGHVIGVHGLAILLHISPGIDHSAAWTWTSELMGKWGYWALFLVALSPLMQHPAIAIAALAGMNLVHVFAFVLSGRAIKYLFLAWLATHAPAFLGRLWGIQHDLEEVGLETKQPPSK